MRALERGVRGGAGRLSARGPWLPGARAPARCLAADGRLVRPLSRDWSGERRRISSASSSGGWRSPCRCSSSSRFGVFALVHLAPGDPVRALLGTRPSDPETLATLRERYHLNDPFIVQYGKWLWQVLQGDLGRSINGNRRVSARSASAPASPSSSACISTLIVLVVGILLGVVAALQARHAARPRHGDVRRVRHLLAGLRHRHLPALCLRRRARLVPDLRRRRAASSTGSGI